MRTVSDYHLFGFHKVPIMFILINSFRLLFDMQLVRRSFIVISSKHTLSNEAQRIKARQQALLSNGFSFVFLSFHFCFVLFSNRYTNTDGIRLLSATNLCSFSLKQRLMALSDVHPIIVILLRYLLLFTLDHDLFSLVTFSFALPFRQIFYFASHNIAAIVSMDDF